MSSNRKRICLFLISVFILLSFSGCGIGGEKAAGESQTSESGEEVITRKSVVNLNGKTTAAGETATVADEAEVSSSAPESTTAGDADFDKWWGSIGVTETTEATTVKPTKKPDGARISRGDGFFDDAVFVGDSVTMGLRNYVTSERNAGRECLGGAQFLCSGSMGYSNTLLPLDHKEGIHPKVNGEKVYVEQGVKLLEGKKVFIMLGMNDYCLYDNDTVVANAEKLIGKITAENPGCEFYIQSVTPVIAAKETKKFNNANIDSLNEHLEAMCEENGWTYIDINSLFKDENNKMNDDFCSDKEAQGIHLSMAGCKVWADYLMNEL